MKDMEEETKTMGIETALSGKKAWGQLRSFLCLIGLLSGWNLQAQDVFFEFNKDRSAHRSLNGWQTLAGSWRGDSSGISSADSGVNILIFEKPMPTGWHFQIACDRTPIEFIVSWKDANNWLSLTIDSRKRQLIWRAKVNGKSLREKKSKSVINDHNRLTITRSGTLFKAVLNVESTSVFIFKAVQGNRVGLRVKGKHGKIYSLKIAGSPQNAASTSNSMPESADVYTGLVIDCRGFGLQRGMSPKIRRPDGSEVLGTIQLSDDRLDQVIEEGLVAYLSGHEGKELPPLDDPAIVKRIGQNPLMIKAIGLAGAANTDPVISDEDAERILQENKRSRFLERLAVLFLK